MSGQHERKSFHSFATKILDADQGIVEHIVAVMGNIDDGGDIIRNGAFTKSLAERGGKVRVLDAHNSDSIMRVIGKPLEMRELKRSELPSDLLVKYPDATGALWAKTQFLLDTPEGMGAFKRIKSGAVDEYSIGYDALDHDYEKVTRNGKDVTVRNLRTLKLYEYSPVLWGMNSATQTLSAKAEPNEIKPYRAIQEDGMWRVYKLDDTGNPTGDPLGEHDTEEEAVAQVRALYAAEDGEQMSGSKVMATIGGVEYPASAFLVVEDPQKPSTWHLQVRDENGELDRRLMGAAWAALHSGYRGNVYEGPGKREAIAELTRLYAEVGADTPKGDNKAGRMISKRNGERIRAAMEALHEVLMEAGLLLDDEYEEEYEDEPPMMGVDNEQQQKAGPVDPPTTQAFDPVEVLKAIDLELIDIELMED